MAEGPVVLKEEYLAHTERVASILAGDKNLQVTAVNPKMGQITVTGDVDWEKIRSMKEVADAGPGMMMGEA